MKGLSISISDLWVAYGDTPVLKGINMTVAPGQFIALLGSSGCGKTTLLRSLAGFQSVSSGDICLGSRSINGLPPEKRDMAMMFQSYALWPHMSVAQNVGYALRLRGHAKAAITDRVSDMLDLVGLSGFKDRKVTALSGGQRQRVALARALAVDPPVLLLDEPLSNLDARIRLSMRHEIKSLQRRLGITAILVTHDREEAMAMADRVIIMDQGVIAQDGSPEQVYQRPESDFVADFMGAENSCQLLAKSDGRDVQLRGQQARSEAILPISRHLGDAGVHCADFTDHDGPITARFRSEAASLCPAGQTSDAGLLLTGTVTQHSYIGATYRHSVAVGDKLYLVDHDEKFAVDSSVDVRIPATALHLFAQDHRNAATGESGRNLS